ncbi:hypothetical protein BDB01DRAFT_570776 [Pilobolus umbonatus]|nr:hypothetical protein BDB01DRAFT_570776 [Pilobolus umbonatus]
MKAKQNNIKIYLENDHLVMYGDPAESNGCVLRGVVGLELTKSIHVKSLELKFSVTVSVQWMKHREISDRRCKEKKVLNYCSYEFLPLNRTKQLYHLSAGYHAYDFEFVLPGVLPETAQLSKTYHVQYELEATASRPSLLTGDLVARKNVHISRQWKDLVLDYINPVTLKDAWEEMLEYEIFIPKQVFSLGETIHASVHVAPKKGQYRVRSVSYSLNEYVTLYPVDNWYNGKRLLQKRFIYNFTKYAYGIKMKKWDFFIDIVVPHSLQGIGCDTRNDYVKVIHKISFTITFEGNHGQELQIKDSSHIYIIQKNTTDNLPGYEDTGLSEPYDPLRMVNLRKHTRQIQYEHGPLNMLPTYSEQNLS